MGMGMQQLRQIQVEQCGQLGCCIACMVITRATGIWKRMACAHWSRMALPEPRIAHEPWLF